MQSLIRTGLLFLVLGYGTLYAQVRNTTPYLEKKVSLKVKALPLADVFRIIEKQTGVIFSYNPKQVNDQEKVTVQYVRVSLRLVLEDLQKWIGFRYKSKNNYIILVAEGKKTTEPSAVAMLSGYVYSSVDGTALENASVYIPSGKYAAVTDQYGYFSISRAKSKAELKLAVAKENFRDTVYMVPEPSTESVKLFLSPEAIAEVAPVTTHPSDPIQKDSVVTAVHKDTVMQAPEKKLSSWPNINKMKVNLKNIKDTFFNNLSLSLVPPISTNKLLAFNTVNKVSFNALVGYSKGVRYAEVGGLVNVDDGDVSYAQVAGIGNSVSGSVKGAQVGGIYSVNKKNTTGVQVSGLYSKTGETVKGGQVGGIFSQAQNVKGIQIGGIFSHTQNKIQGIQIGGIFSKADTITGFQLGGLVSHAQHLSGVQISGLYNYAETMKGFQLAFINVAKEAKGIPFGIFSFVKNGYHKIEVSANELQMVNLGFRTGVDRLHNIVFAGMGVNGTSWTYGYGLGTAFQLGSKWSLCTDLTAQQLNLLEGAHQRLDLVSKVLVAVEFSPVKKLRVAIGPSYNIRVADTGNTGYDTVINKGLVNYFYDHDEGGGSNLNTKMWIGGTLSVKFL